jgi:hypothetical protein
VRGTRRGLKDNDRAKTFKGQVSGGVPLWVETGGGGRTRAGQDLASCGCPGHSALSEVHGRQHLSVTNGQFEVGGRRSAEATTGRSELCAVLVL